MEGLILLLVFGFILLVSFSAYGILTLIDFMREKRCRRIYNRNPDLTNLINEYKNKSDQNNAFYRAHILPLIREERSLREKLTNATKLEYEQYSDRIELLKEERIAQEKINETEHAYRYMYVDIISKIKSLPAKDSKFLLTRYWLEE